jgi:hypothetical protein
MVVGAVVDHERLERLKEQTRAMAGAGALALFARDAAQLLQDEVGADRFAAAEQAAFEIPDQQRTRLR